MMLRRCVLNKNSRSILRLWSDDSNKAPPTDAQPLKEKQLNKAALEKIQSLLDGLKIVNENGNEEQKEFARAPGFFKKQKINAKKVVSKKENIEEEITRAVGDVAEQIGGNKKQTEAELLSQVIDKIIPSPTNLSDVIHGMKVDLKPEKGEGYKQQVLDDMKRKRDDRSSGSTYQRQRRSSLTQSKINIFDAEPLGLFTPASIESQESRPKMEVWDRLEKRELKLAMSQPPANYFEKMIMWTEQGKVWKFPIDNEQGLEEEQNIHFSEHVFVEAYLEGWCPKMGPVRHFMELVCVGLSKNPFYTAKEKKEHIMWFKDYFESKMDVLKEVGALEPPQKEMHQRE